MSDMERNWDSFLGGLDEKSGGFDNDFSNKEKPLYSVLQQGKWKIYRFLGDFFKLNTTVKRDGKDSDPIYYCTNLIKDDEGNFFTIGYYPYIRPDGTESPLYYLAKWLKLNKARVEAVPALNDIFLKGSLPGVYTKIESPWWGRERILINAIDREMTQVHNETGKACIISSSETRKTNKKGEYVTYYGKGVSSYAFITPFSNVTHTFKGVDISSYDFAFKLPTPVQGVKTQPYNLSNASDIKKLNGWTVLNFNYNEIPFYQNLTQDTRPLNEWEQSLRLHKWDDYLDTMETRSSYLLKRCRRSIELLTNTFPDCKFLEMLEKEAGNNGDVIKVVTHTETMPQVNHTMSGTFTQSSVPNTGSMPTGGFQQNVPEYQPVVQSQEQQVYQAPPTDSVPMQQAVPQTPPIQSIPQSVQGYQQQATYSTQAVLQTPPVQPVSQSPVQPAPQIGLTQNPQVPPVQQVGSTVANPFQNPPPPQGSGNSVTDLDKLFNIPF